MALTSAALYLLLAVVPSLILITICRSYRVSPLSRPNQWTPKQGAARFPGPREFPIIGRVYDLPRTSSWLKFKAWTDEYGPVYETSMMGQRFIVVSDEGIATDLLVKMGNHFGGRPQIRALIDHKKGPTYSALQDRNETWKAQRKWVHAAMAVAMQNDFYGHVEDEVKRFLGTLLVDPSRFHVNIRETTGRIMARLTWGDATLGPRYGDEALAALRQMSTSGPLVNTITPLWHLADLVGHNPWRRHEVAREGWMKTWWTDTLRAAKRRFREGTLPGDTWAARYCEQLRDEGGSLEQGADDEEFAACVLGFLCMVGVVTVAGPMQYFVMAMAMHGEWLARVQEEVDRVCGARMPDMGDYAKLPTVRACVKETLRWRPTVPLGVPHECETPTEYRGVHIQQGDIVLALEWALNRAPSVFPDVESYRPERWLEPGWPTYAEPLTQYPSLREGKAMHTFGWGRRACLGTALVDREMFVFAAAVCWAFDLAPRTCPLTGEEVPVNTRATDSNVILEPTPFAVDVRPRSEERAVQVVEMYARVSGRMRV
ncbi:hypothetical protein PLICBS_009699 [Purpureocillium lilacinum]|uniref:uncharacterized protein n=1 Tax=Purpureocillium lilacinum TaxID=33203 RepID=UPI002080F5D9|nr:hypothetical protein PLICBS_009699 [Purpureocillium lilacinum]